MFGVFWMEKNNWFSLGYFFYASRPSVSLQIIPKRLSQLKVFFSFGPHPNLRLPSVSLTSSLHTACFKDHLNWKGCNFAFFLRADEWAWKVIGGASYRNGLPSAEWFLQGQAESFNSFWYPLSLDLLPSFFISFILIFLQRSSNQTRGDLCSRCDALFERAIPSLWVSTKAFTNRSRT